MDNHENNNFLDLNYQQLSSHVQYNPDSKLTIGSNYNDFLISESASVFAADNNFGSILIHQ
jgi:hypothetical protein